MDPEETFHFLNDLRRARAAAQADSEDATALLTCFERLGFHLVRPTAPVGLGDYRTALLAFANSGRIPKALAGDACEATAEDLINSIARGRNDEMHVGISARRLVDHSIRFALMVEAGLMADLELVKHFMVAAPVCAAPWQTLAHVRQTMLLHQFSFLPYRPMGQPWKLIPDHAVANFLRTERDRGEALAKRLEDVVPIRKEMTLDAPLVGPGDNVAKLPTLALPSLPWLVVEGADKTLRGILTPFDLL